MVLITDHSRFCVNIYHYFRCLYKFNKNTESTDRFIFHLNVPVQNLIKIRSTTAEIFPVKLTGRCTGDSFQRLFTVLGIVEGCTGDSHTKS